MITNFEIITADLTDEEKKLIPLLIRGFVTKTKLSPVKAPEIIERINSKKEELGLAHGITEPRLRKLCNVIRTEGIIPLIATSKGYYVSHDPEEIRDQIKSLHERAGAILSAANGLNKFLPK